jgi:RHS repeat-associated protein
MNSAFGGNYLYTGLFEDRTSGIFIAQARADLTTIGRWMQEDPITFRAGDPNIYRYVGNNPTNTTDLSGLKAISEQQNVNQFKYTLTKMTFNPTAIGYSGQLTIDWSKLRDPNERPKTGTWIQGNVIQTSVVTVDKNGKFGIHRNPTKYISDKTDAGSLRYNDTIQGPQFDESLVPDTVLVVSYVTKDAGFTDKDVPEKTGGVLEAPQYATFVDRMGLWQKGNYSYYYVWLDGPKATARGVKELRFATLVSLGGFLSFGPEFDIIMKGLNRLPDRDKANAFAGQIFEDNKGWRIEANLAGKITKQVNP